jgi:hypothetical protein
MEQSLPPEGREEKFSFGRLVKNNPYIMKLLVGRELLFLMPLVQINKNWLFYLKMEMKC